MALARLLTVHASRDARRVRSASAAHVSAAATGDALDLACLLPSVVFQLDPGGHVTYLNPAWTNLTGFAIAECLGRSWLEYVYALDRAHAISKLGAVQAADAASEAQCTLRLRRHGQEGVWAHVAVRAQVDEHGVFAGVVGSLHDITTLKRHEAGLERRALHDPLTGLANRTLLHDRLQHREERAQRQPDEIYAVAYLDLDDLKAVNDTHGHRIGDLALTAVAHRLQRAVRAADTVARYGGDEFVILFDSIQLSRGEPAIRWSLRTALRAPLTLAGNQLTVRASLGLALSDAPHTRPRELIDLADQAMYRRKNRRRQ